MASNNNSNKKTKPRAPKEGANPKKFKKKTSVLLTDKVEYVDYKDVNLLTRFVSDRSKIRNRRVTGNTVQQQRDIANAIKNSREMALLPYTKRVAQTRTSRPPRDGDGRRGRDDAPQRESQVAGTDVDVIDIDVAELEGVEVDLVDDTDDTNGATENAEG
jgi:small subunit ribosomal protein S18